MKTYNPLTPSLRHKISPSKDYSNQNNPIKKLTFGLIKNGGRNNHGRITVRHQGGGHKQRYRIIDFNRKYNEGIVLKIEYDPNRTSNLALLQEKISQAFYYIIAPNKLKIGDIVKAYKFSEDLNIPQMERTRIGNSMPIGYIPVGTFIHNLEYSIHRGGQLIRSAGSYGIIISQDARLNYTSVKLPSSEIRLIRKECVATIGQVSNIEHDLTVLGKAGANRWRGIRPTVRGVAMNPVDHPHGGGEGKTSGGRPSVSPWGRLTKGKPTRKIRKNKRFIISKKR